MLQRDSWRHSIVRVRSRIGDDRRVRPVAEKSFKLRSAANQKMQRPEKNPLRNEPGRVEHVSGEPKRIGLAVVVLVRLCHGGF